MLAWAEIHKNELIKNWHSAQKIGKVKKVVQVLPTDDFKVYVYFEDGKIKLFDMSHLVGNRDQYECLDIDPFTIYEEGADVSDPLAS